MVSRRSRVRVVPTQPHSLAFGGFEVQMLSALTAAKAAGADVSPLDPWSRDGAFDVIHLWGLEPHHVPTAEWAVRSGKRVVVTALLPFVSVRGVLGRARAIMSGRAALQARLIALADRVVLLDELQFFAARTLFCAPRDRLTIIPNIIDRVYLEPSEPHDRRGVLCVGSICVRKNQLRLAQACELAGMHLTLVGDVVPGEEPYADAVSAVVTRAGGKWLRHVEPFSRELVSLYRGAKVFALCSFSETQPISLLEAMAAGCAIVTSDRPFSRQRAFKSALVVDPSNVGSISRAVISAAAEPAAVNHQELSEFTAESVGRAYFDLYDALPVSRR